MFYPLTFRPIFKERIWGGRNLERLYAKPLPPAVPIGESWEITDRPEGVSEITNGPLAGRDLRWLMENHAAELLGRTDPTAAGRFPLLVKILDAQDVLSLQVHPPAALAPSLGGEPKTEMWYFAETTPTAEIFVGLKRGVTRAEFEQRLADGSVAQCFHRHAVRAGNAMFLPSGRVHALGAGSVIFEIQQNSDTTYRVFDWNRRDKDGNLRELHIAQGLASIDFTDFEPPLIPNRLAANSAGPTAQADTLVSDPLFEVTLRREPAGRSEQRMRPGLLILAVLAGELTVTGGGQTVVLRPGQFCLLPAALAEFTLAAHADAKFLQVRPG
ncbi:mannose-6-phosphate isomerase [Verrucomicrobiota bacterium]|nr:mannose-6-phosphate isomerase [Verrucomicrobiota bacterium]